jgi:hypothetical protein
MSERSRICFPVREPIFRTFFSAENSVEFLGKTIFQNFFRGKFHFFPTFWGEIFRGIFPEIFPVKNLQKISPGKTLNHFLNYHLIPWRDSILQPTHNSAVSEDN